MPATRVLISACAAIRGSGGDVAGGTASAQSDAIKAMRSDILHLPSPVQRWSRRGPAATGRQGDWRRALWLAAAAIALGAGGCGTTATYRAVRPNETILAAAAGLRVEVGRLFLTDDT